MHIHTTREKKSDDSTKTIRIAQFGLGPIGIETLRLLTEKPWATIVGGIDIDPAKLGKSLADLGIDGCDQKVFASFSDLVNSCDKPDVILHTAGSKAADAMRQMQPIVEAGVSVVSSCEELLFPLHRAPNETRAVDSICKKTGARIVGTGVNPGFVMDVLPICLTGVCRNVEAIHMQRVVNASLRRQPLQKKIGSGMDPQAFREMFKAGKAGHAGFQESAMLVAHCMGWQIEKLAETCEPVIADRVIETKFFTVKIGQTRGLHQRAIAIVNGHEAITMDLKMMLDADDPHDAAQIVGDPPIDMRLNGGVHGDSATVAALVNAVPRILHAAPGVRLMSELPLPSIA